MFEQAATRTGLTGMGANARALAAREFDRKSLARQWTEWVTGVPRRLRGTSPASTSHAGQAD
jgi:hypothetical protein